MKKHKGLLSGIGFLILNLFIFGFLPLPMLAYSIVTIIGDDLALLFDSDDYKEISFAINSILILFLSILCLLKIRKSQKKFDWLMVLFVFQFLFFNGLAFKFLEFSGAIPTEIKFIFIAKTSLFFIWIYPFIGWCYDRWWNTSEEEILD